MIEPTRVQRDAASVVFNLPDYHVIDAIDLPLGGRGVVVQANTIAEGCSACGIVSERVHGWCRQQVKDVLHAGRIEVVVMKPRLVCAERGICGGRSPRPPASCHDGPAAPSRLKTALLSAVIDLGQPVAQVAKTHQVAWWTTQKTVNAAVDTLADVDDLRVSQLGVDEHRYRKVSWYRNPDSGGWQWVEPWMIPVVNVACGQVLGVVEGRGSAAVEAWLNDRSQVWRDRISVVAIDPSAAFKKEITTSLTNAKIAVDPFHLVQLANLTVTRVRQRLRMTTPSQQLQVGPLQTGTLSLGQHRL